MNADTSAVEAVIQLAIKYNPDAIMVMKSTIPVGFTSTVREKYRKRKVFRRSDTVTIYPHNARRS